MSAGDAPRTAEDWRGYLGEYGAVYVRTANEYQRSSLTTEQIESHWLGAEPADEQTIAAAEQRLGIRFPPSLRVFLTVTDGWQGLGGWVHEISPCAELDWLRNTGTGEELIDIYAEVEQEEGEPSELLALFRRALVIAGGEDLWLLDPAEIQPDGEWTAYEFAPKYGEAEEYPGFAELFHASKELMISLAETGDQ
ncbi:SMI1/KNR4 family protein [Amycolatopsis pithecellobii]|uniref:SMI1/KNR4 family protein n=1 Tax=Amycolatopsis pithecellobii TaxID=664692 RepID=A0A6N7Z1M3_9PSEU|nr:SMI1/KNR4 family protein [Amycolatopsis pithecellobii]MTD53464.1 SMI1/KNR4 family protein [Amycolatopsis pithecellobii]